MTTSFPMNDGNSAYSYFNNSQRQKELIDASKDMVRDVIIAKLDVEVMLSSSHTFRIIELGCSIGPNTFHAMQHVVDVVKEKYHNINLEFQVFLVTMSKTISTPFFDHYLLIDPTMHLEFQDLFMIPKELLDEKSSTWNKGLIHYGTSNIDVVNAYIAQFEKDMEIFFNARAEEIVPGGMMVFISPFSSYTRLVEFFGSSLMDLVNEGKLDESLVDSFNLPMYFPSPQDMTKVVEKNGCFSIEKMELAYPKSKLVDEIDAKTFIINLRAVLEGLLINHFGSKIAEEVCARTLLKSEEISTWMKANGGKSCQLFVALKRK
ncbi:hypothetical protein H5410_000105 [Solanum commersonii]|uniref:Uncharacterized protein n=1 Tax=Solanum commersonii TaxID=4109 RepID=A0A9J6AVB8_SOLCO|nr:hypothetical protein H5410_000105 [Solanum commersonii]